MANMIDMQLMRYINLFERISRVSTTSCFVYNGTIIFAVPRTLVSRAIGKDAVNVKRIRDILGRKVKIIEQRGINDVDKFISDVVEPCTFNKIEIIGDELIINTNRQSKAALIGRNRVREEELRGILSNFYNIEKLRIV